MDSTVLSAAEHRRAARFTFSRDAQRYVAARHALRWVLSQALGCSPQSVAIATNPSGKPHLVPDLGLDFSVSHSGY